ncbi:hypothetical protein MMC07_004930 [Pseudocyphellaria aurata]|nr:hypothetical protein [Pseudocyphellaria aurata]
MDDEKPFPAGLHPELIVKPVIKELARTQVCFPNLKLLVDRISIVTVPDTLQSTANKAFRLYLTDGERSIQGACTPISRFPRPDVYRIDWTAVLKRKCYKHVTSFDVREGSYVVLRNYRLARGRRLSGMGNVIYIIIEDFYSIGEEQRDNVDQDRYDRYSELIRTPQHQSIKSIDDRFGSTQRRKLDVHDGEVGKQDKNQENSPPPNGTSDSSRGSTREANLTSKALEEESPISPRASARPEQMKRKRDDPFDELDPNLTPRIIKMTKLAEETFSVRNNTKGPNIPPVVQYRHPLTVKAGAGENASNQNNVTPKKKQHIAGGENSPADSNKSAENLGPAKPTNPANRPPRFITRSVEKPKAPLPIQRPLQLRSLESLTGQHATRNKVHDVFAVICSVDATTIKPPTMPLKRDMRIMDPSTDKKVLVSVFVDPEHFKPRVGTVALFRSLTTHEWDRGMLNVYPQQCGGKAWFVPDPVGVPGCDVDAMKDWWRRKTDENSV